MAHTFYNSKYCNTLSGPTHEIEITFYEPLPLSCSLELFVEYESEVLRETIIDGKTYVEYTDNNLGDYKDNAQCEFDGDKFTLNFDMKDAPPTVREQVYLLEISIGWTDLDYFWEYNVMYDAKISIPFVYQMDENA